MRYYTLLKTLLLIFLLISVATLDSYAQKKSKVKLRGAKHIRSDKNIKNGARRLIGNVVFEQDSTVMECDSAYFYSDKNMFDAYGNVHLYKKGDATVDVRSDFLRHNGDLKMAHFRNNVVLRDTQVVLYTDSLDYDIDSDIGYYIHGGTIVDSATTLTSRKGYYYSNDKLVYFKTNVEIKHNEGEYQMYTDTLCYGTETKIVDFFGPTEFYNDTNYMSADYGWYNTDTDQAFFKQEAFYSNPNQNLVADSLYYDRNENSGKAYSNVVITDTVQNIIVKGNYVEMNQEEEWFFVTDSAHIIGVMDGDSVFIHADTLYSDVDSTKEYRSFIAYHHVKIFKSNFQAKTDSLYFSLTDSIVQFHGSPVLWAEGNQISSEYIEAFIVDEKMDHFKLYKLGLIISEYDGTHFNQIKGKNITGYLKDNSLYKIEVKKKSETIYFPEDEEGVIGVNKANSENISIYMKDNEVQRIIYREQPISNTYPLPDLQDKEMKVKDFVWLEDIKPLRPTDIFLWDSNTTPYNVQQQILNPQK